MARDAGNKGRRHPDAADCPEGLPGDEAAAHPPLVRRHAGGHTRCWIEGGEMRSRDVAGDGTPEALPGRSRRSSVRCRRGWRRARARGFRTRTAAGGRSGTPRRAAARRGLHDAGGPVVVSDGADWIPNACEELFGGRKAAFVLDMWHSLECASDAVKAILPPGRNGTGGSRRRGGRQAASRLRPPVLRTSRPRATRMAWRRP